MPKTGLEAWRISLTMECVDEEEADIVFESVQELMDDIGFTHWSAKMIRDIDFEKALATFRKNKKEILSTLPKEVVEQYYPEGLERHLAIVPELEAEDEKNIDKSAS
jgi:hypothetical protein